MTELAPPAPPAPPPAPTLGKAAVLLALLGLFAYYDSFQGAFVLDDGRFTTDPNIRRPFHSSMAARPLIALSLALNHALDGYEPRGYHLLNLAAHVVAALALFDLLKRTLVLPHFGGAFGPWAGWVALVAAAVWLAHPLQTQSVTYIVQRCESMMGMFFLLSLWCFLRGATAGERGRWWFAGSVAACALGTGCKEMTVALPPLALLYDRTFLSGSWRAALRARWGVFAALSVPPALGVVAMFATGLLTDSAGTVGFGVKIYSPWTYALTQTEVIFRYLRLSFWPTGLCLDYLDWVPRKSLGEVWPAALGVVALVLATGWGVVRGTGWGFLGAWFLLILAPTSSIVPLQDAVFEHRMYLPLAAVVVLVVCGAAALARRLAPAESVQSRVGVALAALSGAVVVVLGIATAARNEDYSSTTRLYEDNVAKRPNNPRIRQNLALQYFAAGRVAEAEAEIDTVMRLPYNIPSLRAERVRILREVGRTAEAVALAAQVLTDEPGSDAAAYDLGLCLLADGHPAEAEPYLRRRAASAPDDKFARLHFGVALENTGRAAGADIEYRAAAALDPDYAAQLVRTAHRAALDPNAKPSNLRLSAWYAQAACRMKPDAPAEFRDALAACLARVGRFPEAAAEAGRAAELARARGDGYMAARYDARAARYKSGRPYLPDPLPEAGKP